MTACRIVDGGYRSTAAGQISAKRILTFEFRDAAFLRRPLKRRVGRHGNMQEQGVKLTCERANSQGGDFDARPLQCVRRHLPRGRRASKESGAEEGACAREK